MRVARRPESEDLEGPVTLGGELRLACSVSPFPIVRTLPIELVVQPWEAAPEQTCVVPFHAVSPVRFNGRLSVTGAEVPVDVNPSWGFLEPVLKPAIGHFLRSKGRAVSHYGKPLARCTRNFAVRGKQFAQRGPAHVRALHRDRLGAFGLKAVGEALQAGRGLAERLRAGPVAGR